MRNLIAEAKNTNELWFSHLTWSLRSDKVIEEYKGPIIQVEKLFIKIIVQY